MYKKNILGHYWCSVVTSVSLSSNLSKFEKNPNKIQKNSKKSQNGNKSKKPKSKSKNSMQTQKEKIKIQNTLQIHYDIFTV